ncbi:hypothetical protein BSKO_05738 [Bryopsis sp. KO-2023]|nr:hypothetical protein BSKO_05738 [Bryopsis sp. KO-2023]
MEVVNGGIVTRSSARAKQLCDIVARFSNACELSAEQVSTKLAAVLIALFQDSSGDIRVWLNERSKSVSTHKGEVCLPGGRKDKDDTDEIHTALREAHEEIGLPPEDVNVIGKFRPILSKHHLSVTPVISLVSKEFQPMLNVEEVSAAFHIPLKSFLVEKNHFHEDMEWNDFKYRLHFFEHEGFRIWGLTATILIQVAKIAFDTAPEFDEFGPGGNYWDVCSEGGQMLIRSQNEKTPSL